MRCLWEKSRFADVAFLYWFCGSLEAEVFNSGSFFRLGWSIVEYWPSLRYCRGEPRRIVFAEEDFEGRRFFLMLPLSFPPRRTVLLPFSGGFSGRKEDFLLEDQRTTLFFVVRRFLFYSFDSTPSRRCLMPPARCRFPLSESLPPFPSFPPLAAIFLSNRRRSFLLPPTFLFMPSFHPPYDIAVSLPAAHRFFEVRDP